MIFYAWGDRTEKDLQVKTDSTTWPAVGIHLDSLVQAVGKATERFVGDLQKDERLAQLVWSRAGKMIGNYRDLPG